METTLQTFKIPRSLAIGLAFGLVIMPALITPTTASTSAPPAADAQSHSGSGHGVAEEHGLVDLPVDGVVTGKRYVLRYPTPASTWNGTLVMGVHGGTGGDLVDVDGSLMSTSEIALDDVIADHALAEGYAYASVDRDGIGASSTEVAIIAAFTARMHDRLEVATSRAPERTYLVGLSMGGGITRMAAEDPSSRYDGVVIIAGASGDLQTRLERTAEGAALWADVDPRLDSPLPDDHPKVKAYSKTVETPPAARVFWPFTGVGMSYDNLRRSLEGYGLTGLSDDQLREFTFERHRSNEAFADSVEAANTTGRLGIDNRGRRNLRRPGHSRNSSVSREGRACLGRGWPSPVPGRGRLAHLR